MTILKRDIHERMNNSDRGISIAQPLTTNEINMISYKVRARVREIYNIDIVISGDEIIRVYNQYVNRITKVIIGKTLKDMAMEMTYNEIMDHEIGKVSQRIYQSSLSYPASIQATQTSNTNLIKGAVRTKRSVAGVTGGVRLF
jgi:hypothetical protein